MLLWSHSFVLSTFLSKNLKTKIYKTKILTAVLYGCETWSLILRDELRRRVFENRILKRIFGSKMGKFGQWRRLHNKELHKLYRSLNIVRVIKSRKLRPGKIFSKNGKRYESFWNFNRQIYRKETSRKE